MTKTKVIDLEVTSDGEMTRTKVIDLNDIYNFVV
jgi:hypothetical protein